MKLRIAIYGRHSSAKQNSRSSEDQAALCQRVVDYLGGTVIGVYLDPEVSGYRRDRSGLKDLLRDVRDGHVDVVVCEALDRIARDAEDVAWLGKKLKFSKVRLHTVLENEIDDIKLAVASMLGSIFLAQLQQKTLRGMQAAVLAGRFAGGKAYGYQKVIRLDERGEPVRGILEIVDAEAAVVRRIYGEYAAGRSARDIAKRLNAERIPSPRGGHWNQSTVRGDPKKHVGILNNPLYRGVLLWGRREWRKDPDSERRERRYRLRDEGEWTRVAVPDMRIIDDALVEAVAAEMARRVLPKGATSSVVERRPKHILSGLIKCGVCRANFVVGSKDYYRCASVKERGTCGNSTTIRISRVEDLALSTLQSDLLTDEHTRLFATEFNREVEKLRREEKSQEGDVTNRLKDLEQEIENLAANMLNGVTSQIVVRMLADREAECDMLKRRINGLEKVPSLVLVRPSLRTEFEARVADLRHSLSDPRNRPEIAKIVAGLIEEIIVYPATDGHGAEAEITAQVSSLINFTNTKSRPPYGSRLSSNSAIKVVAGTGFEPVTFRL